MLAHDSMMLYSDASYVTHSCAKCSDTQSSASRCRERARRMLHPHPPYCTSLPAAPSILPKAPMLRPACKAGAEGSLRTAPKHRACCFHQMLDAGETYHKTGTLKCSNYPLSQSIHRGRSIPTINEDPAASNLKSIIFHQLIMGSKVHGC